MIGFRFFHKRIGPVSGPYQRGWKEEKGWGPRQLVTKLGLTFSIFTKGASPAVINGSLLFGEAGNTLADEYGGQTAADLAVEAATPRRGWLASSSCTGQRLAVIGEFLGDEQASGIH